MSAPPSTVKPKLTKEEKRAALAQKKLDKKLAAEEKRRQDFRDHLKREIEFTKKSRGFLDKHWLEICSEVGREDLVVSLNCMRQNVLRTLDEKQRIIDKFLGQLEHAEVEYVRLFRAHVRTLDYLLSKTRKITRFLGVFYRI